MACLAVGIAGWCVEAPSAKASEEKPAAPIQTTGPRDVLRQFGIDDSRFDQFVDGRLLHVDEQETLLRVLYRLDDLRLEDIDHWIHKRLDLDTLVKDARAQCGQVFPIRGRVLRVDVEHPLPEVVERFEMKEYYCCEIELAESRQVVLVYAQAVPKAWQAGGAIDQRGGAQGFFLKLGSTDAARPRPIFAARRVAWYPADPLGDLGFDAGLLDDVKDKESIRPEEREAFYQMLWCVGRAKPGQLRQEAERQIRDLEKKAEGDPEKIAREVEADTNSNSVVPLFLEPERCRGRLVVVTGEARKVVLIRVDDEDIRNRFGIDHYYEVSLFTPDSQGNPLVFCVRELPEGLSPGEGARYWETVRVAGFFMKVWSYRVPPPPDVPEAQRESAVWKKQAPLLIAQEPLWYPVRQPPTTTLAGAIAGGVFLVVLLAIWAIVWRSSRADKAFHEKTIARNLAADSGISLDAIGLDADGKPDFSTLPQANPPGDGDDGPAVGDRPA